MKKYWLVALIGLVSMGVVSAEMRYADRAMSQYDESYKTWETSFASTPDDATRLELLKNRPNPRRTTQTILKHIGAQLNDPSTMRAIAWIYENDAAFLQHPDAGEAGKAIRNSLLRSHYNKPGAGDLCIAISQSFSTQDLAFLEKVAKQAANEEEQGLASLAVSIALSNLGDDAGLVAKRLEHLRSAIKKVPEDKTIRGKKVTDIISDQLYVIQFLSKGRKAPNINGKDIAGVPVTLPVGKVTAIVFWSGTNSDLETWLPILQGTYKTAQQCGAAMVGVYTGDSATLRQKISEREVPWENVFDQQGEITKNYRINQSPTIFLLDKAGRIQSIGEPNALINLSMQALADGAE